MSTVLLDDHLLRDLLADEVGGALASLLEGSEPATTNLYLYRLCRSALAASGGALTGSWAAARRRQLAAALLGLPEHVTIVPMRDLAVEMAGFASSEGLSTLGAEAVAASARLSAPLCVWEGDDGPRIRAAMARRGADYRLVPRER
ncbi:MAG TPA: hypothetical protein VNF07_09420 [Acidimicrobiales bacterium]|nr:hypothetical protein [Acidimicrobiales bacterium]